MASMAITSPVTVSPAVPKLRKRDYVHKAAAGIVGGHIGAFTAIALYYLFTQTNGYIHELWNSLFPFAWIVVSAGLFTEHPVWPNPLTTLRRMAGGPACVTWSRWRCS